MKNFQPGFDNDWATGHVIFPGRVTKYLGVSWAAREKEEIGFSVDSLVRVPGHRTPRIRAGAKPGSCALSLWSEREAARNLLPSQIRIVSSRAKSHRRAALGPTEKQGELPEGGGS